MTQEVTSVEKKGTKGPLPFVVWRQDPKQNKSLGIKWDCVIQGRIFRCGLVGYWVLAVSFL